MKPKVLILIDWYVPGYRAGGPIQSVKNLVESLEDRVEFHVLTGDKDLGAESAYENTEFDKWLPFSQHFRCYTSPENRKRIIRDSVKDHSFSFIYLNSLFSKQFTLTPLYLCWHSGLLSKVVLAPRGMLGEGALQLKSKKKKLFLLGFKALGIHKRIIFHSTDASESKDIRKVLSDNIRIEEISNLSIRPKAVAKTKSSELVKFLYTSRINPKKNLHLAIEALLKLNVNFKLDVFGESDDEAYRDFCIKLVHGKSSVVFHNAIQHDALCEEYLSHDFFILLTKNENFGHSIIESLSYGTPVIISDQTPWSDIEEFGAGIVLPLKSAKNEFVSRVSQLIAISDEDYLAMSKKAIEYVHAKINLNAIQEQYLNLFRD